MPPHPAEPPVDPRIRRTRAALREALATLLRDRSFDEVTLNEVAEAAGLNRATIYKHYPDKFALLDAWIADDLRQRLFAAIDGCEWTGEGKMAAVIGATCECMRWVFRLGRPDDRLLLPIAEARISSLVLQTVRFALAEKVARAVAKSDLAAPMASAAICGAASVWAASDATSPRALEAHVAKTMAALATLVVPVGALPRMTKTLTFT